MRHLSLQHQLLFTSGGCADFASAYHEQHGGKLCILWCKDKRQFKQHDWPPSVPLALHAVVMREDGLFVDAEGVRPLNELLESFGVKPGFSYRMDEGVRDTDLTEAFGERYEDRVTLANELMKDSGWGSGVPACDNRLTQNFEEAQELLRAEMEEDRLSM